MKSSRFFWSLSLCALLCLALAGCGSGSGSSTPPSTQTVQLTVTAPAAGQGTITSNPSGINCPTTCTASFASGTKVTLTVTPGTNYLFTGWGGACSGMSCTITLTSAETVSANFSAGDGVSVALAGSGTGTVTSTPAGINCPTTCAATFAKGTSVVLTETPGTNFYFGGWTGACTGSTACNVTVNAAENITATFTAGDVLTISTTGTGTGTVSSAPAGINCTSGAPAGCSATFAPGTSLMLTETPSGTSQFSGWSGACSGTTSTCSLTLSSASSSASAGFAPPGTIASLEHIILYAQENRSLDHYFGAMLPYWQSMGLHQNDGVTFDGLAQFNSGGTAPAVSGCAPGTWGGSCSPQSTNPISSFHLQTSCIENQSPFWNEAHNQWDYANPTGGGGMNDNDPPLDGFAFTAAYDADSNGFMDIEGVRAMGYYDSTDLNYYYFMASNFATSDRWFAPIMSRTQLNRMYMIGATSYGHAYPLSNGEAQIPTTPIFEALQNKGVSWKIYVNEDGTPCQGMTGSQLSACLLENDSYLNQFTYEGTVLNNPTLLANIVPETQFATDAQNNALPSFALIEPASSAGLDEHPSDSDAYAVNVQDGMNYSAGIINSLMASPSWSSSALIFTYDEWGGLYDHVPPQPMPAPGQGPLDQGDPLSPTDLVSGDICYEQGGTDMCNFSWTGFRVPVIVISPFAKQYYVSHTVRDTTSVLNLVEERFGLQPLTNRDANQPLMDEFFNFANPPWMTPPTPPAPATGLVCDQTPPPGPYSPGGGWGEPPQLSVAVKSGSGTITSTPAGISCDTDFTYQGQDVCGYVFPAGTPVTLTATPNTGSTFEGWSSGTNTGPCSGTSPTCTFTMSSGDAEYVQAIFQ